MEINICHLYPDLLNTYGDLGNVLILKYRCEKRGIKVNITNVSLNDEFEEEKYDIVFFGGGQDYEQSIVSEDLELKKDKIKSYVENNKVFLAICGGYQLLGNYYEKSCGEKIKGLEILDLYTKSGKKRFIGNIVIEDTRNNVKYVGFENHFGKTYLGDKVEPLGKVVSNVGYGNNGEDGYEGVVYKNTIGTYLHGSGLSKNPILADRIIKNALAEKYNKEITLKRLDDEYEILAKEYIINKLVNK